MKAVSIPIGSDATVPFDRWLAGALTDRIGRPVPRGLARKAIVSGLVTVGGRIERKPAFVPRRGPTVYVRSLDWLPAMEPAKPVRVLHEDAWLIAVDKPAGLPTHETKDPGRPSLTQWVEGHCGRRPAVHHRLDAGTSGVVLFGKAPEADGPLAAAFSGRGVSKSYVAVSRRPSVDWPDAFIIESPLLVAGNGSVRVDPTGRPARTEVRVLARRSDRLLLQVSPVTGRKHQIRAHLASIDAPVVGDSRYGGPSSPTGRLMLHAEKLELDHPVTGSRLVITSPWPAEFGRPWARPGAQPAAASTRPASPPRPEAGRRAASTPSHFRPADGARPPSRGRKREGPGKPGGGGAGGPRR